MKKRPLLNLLLVGCFILAYGQAFSQTSLSSIAGKRIESLVEVTSDTRSSVIGLNNKNIQPIPTGRKQTTIRQVEFKKESTGLQGIFTIPHIKATIYGSSGESTYDSDNTFERSGNAAMFAIRADPWVAKKMKSHYKIEGTPIEPMDEKALPTWLVAIPRLSNNPEWSGLIQTSLPKTDIRIGMTWTDTIQSAGITYINSYKVVGISEQTVNLTINGNSAPSLDSPSTTSESKGSVYNGTIEVVKDTGIIQKLELKRESELSEVIMNTKVSSVTTTKTLVTNKIL